MLKPADLLGQLIDTAPVLIVLVVCELHDKSLLRVIEAVNAVPLYAM